MSAESLDKALARAVAEGKKATAELRQLVNQASLTLGAAIQRLGPTARAVVPVEAEAIEDSALFLCSACGKSERVALSRLEQKVKCSACAHPLQLGPESARGLAETVIRQFVRTAEGHQRRVGELLRRQEASLNTFNLVFFGRTGVGKSSLVEALSRGDGKAVSEGPSDWTREVRAVRWRSCRLVDTPGIGGWGRGIARAELEARARSAVETADVVLLCFDNQNQQATEFARVAEWVQAYGKPAIALLNVRNHAWRRPDRARTRAERRQYSKPVADHGVHIEEELTNIGLSGTPVIALSAQRALFARASEPYRGPHEAPLRSLREKLGVAKIERWSNLAALEDLLVSAIREDAAGLRVGMLRRELRGELVRVAEGLEQLARSSLVAAEGLDSLVDSTLRVVGYPRADVGDARAVLYDPSGVDLLAELERLRGSPFLAASAGELQVYSEQMLAARLFPLRARSLGAAEKVIEEAFVERETISSEDFRQRVFDLPAMEAVAREVVAEVERFLQRKVRLAAMDVQTELRWQARGVHVDGRAGRSAKETADWLDVAKVTSSAVATGTFFLANPVGLIVSLLSGIGSLVFGWLSKRSRKEAEEKRAQARREALESARREVQATYDRLVEDLSTQVAVLARRALATVLVEPLRTAVALRTVAAEAWHAGTAIQETCRSIQLSEPQRILRAALRRVEEARLPGDPAARRRVWLGEDWIDDPEELLPDDVETTDSPPCPVRSDGDVATTRRLRSALLTAPCPRIGAADGWLAEGRAALREHPRIQGALAEIEELAGGSPRVHVLGDYNAGKSSLIRRLLVDSGGEVPDDLEIGAAPTTERERAYSWEGLVLLDTPGFQSGRSGDAEEALRSVADAAVVLYVMTPSLVTGAPDHLDPLFRGDREAGRAAKRDRTLFVINRADEVGPDPLEAPEELSRIRERKVEELILALQSRSIGVDRRQITFTASDPAGAVGARRRPSAESYDAHRTWDGVDALSKALRTAGEVRRREWVEVGVLHGATARMAALARTVRDEEATLQEKEAWLDGARAALAEAAEGASRLERAIAGRFERLTRDHAYGLLSDVLGATTDEEIQVQTRRLQKWWEEPAFQKDAARWHEQTRKELDGWFARAEEVLGRRFASAELRRTFPELAARLEGDDLAVRPMGFSKILDLLKGGLRAFSERSILYGAVKALGGKFAPWGVVNWTRRFATASKVLGPVGLAVDVFDVWRQHKAEEARERARIEAVRWVHESTARIIEGALRTSNDEGPGPVAYIAAIAGQLESAASTFAAEAASRRVEREALAAERAAVERLRRSAEEKLGSKETEAEHA